MLPLVGTPVTAEAPIPPMPLAAQIIGFLLLAFLASQIYTMIRYRYVWFGPRTAYYRRQPIYFLVSSGLVIICFLIALAGMCLILYVDYLYFLR
jgi:hypothetical protein